MIYGMCAAARHAILDRTSRRRQQQQYGGAHAEASMLEARTGYQPLKEKLKEKRHGKASSAHGCAPRLLLSMLMPVGARDV